MRKLATLAALVVILAVVAITGYMHRERSFPGLSDTAYPGIKFGFTDDPTGTSGGYDNAGSYSILPGFDDDIDDDEQPPDDASAPIFKRLKQLHARSHDIENQQQQIVRRLRKMEKHD